MEECAISRGKGKFGELCNLMFHNTMPTTTHFWGETVRIKLNNIEIFFEDVRSIMNRAAVIFIAFEVCCSCKNSAWTN